jgi:FAD/FMN-containing dehydrogenase
VEPSTLTRRAFLRTSALTALGAAALGGCGRTAALSAPPRTAATAESTTAVATTAEASPPTPADWAHLRRSLSGRLVLPPDPSYGQAKLVYDLRYEDARPAAIAYAASSTDVQRLVDFARRHELAPIPRCGGHSYAGYSTGSGLVVDVSPLSAVRVAGSRATVGAGTRLVDMYSALAGSGVLVPGGTCPTVGIAGLALGGGIGVLGRKYGLTADALEALTMVTADGRVLDVNGDSEPELYWASRGGGGRNFGIVTSLRFAARPIPPLAMFTLDFPWSAAADVLGAWPEWIERAPDELWSNCQLLSGGPGSLLARCTGVYVGGTTPLANLVGELTRAVGVAAASSSLTAASYLDAMLIEAGCAEITLARCQLAAPGSPGILARSAFAAKSAYFSRAPDDRGIAAIIRTVESFQSQLPTLGGALAFDSYGGAINAVAPGATAFVHRDALCQLQTIVSWGSGASRSTIDSVHAWLAESASALAPYTNGQAYQNYIDPTLADWPKSYYGSNLPRLRRVKRTYDPDDVFRFAQSIPPAARA